MTTELSRDTCWSGQAGAGTTGVQALLQKRRCFPEAMRASSPNGPGTSRGAPRADSLPPARRSPNRHADLRNLPGIGPCWGHQVLSDARQAIDALSRVKDFHPFPCSSRCTVLKSGLKEKLEAFSARIIPPMKSCSPAMKKTIPRLMLSGSERAGYPQIPCKISVNRDSAFGPTRPPIPFRV